MIECQPIFFFYSNMYVVNDVFERCVVKFKKLFVGKLLLCLLKECLSDVLELNGKLKNVRKKKF